jgi:hypothetical protein
MKAVRVSLHLPLLGSIIGLPKKFKITRIRQQWEDELNNKCELLIESDEFEDLTGGQLIPEALIVVTIDADNKVTATVSKK